VIVYLLQMLVLCIYSQIKIIYAVGYAVFFNFTILLNISRLLLVLKLL